MENATDLIYELDENGKFTFVNPVMESASGFKKDELLSMIYWDLVHPDHKARVTTFYKQQRKNKIENTYVEFIMTNRAGHSVWIGQIVRIIFKAGYVYKVSAISRNISELKKTEQKLESSEQRFRLLSSNAPVGIFETDAPGKRTSTLR